MELCRDKSNVEIVYRMLKTTLFKTNNFTDRISKAFNPI